MMYPGIISLATAQLHQWPPFATGLALIAAIIAISRWRQAKPALPAGGLILTGLVLLSLAAGKLTWKAADKGQVVVMVDLSPSTRTAQYRNSQTLHTRINRLLGDNQHRLVFFAQTNTQTSPQQTLLDDLPAERTSFSPPLDANAILLFSDCQFDLPATSPPVFVAVDPMLQNPPDAAVRKLEIRRNSLFASLQNQDTNPAQALISPGNIQESVSGAILVSTPLPDDTNQATARILANDPWPENNALAIRVPPPIAHENWWVGLNAPPGWRPVPPNMLPDSPADYLTPAVIVLDNVPTTDLTDLRQQRLEQYVRDLGGTLVILGGHRAFAAGQYPGTPLERLSPLASDPPNPTLHWIILADCSGSMAQREQGATRWDQVRMAIATLLPSLPPNDPVTVGSFAENLRWWSIGKSAKQTPATPPADLQPFGPTNLENALLNLIAAADPAMPKQLLLLTDADADIQKMDPIRQGLLQKQIRLDLLALRDDGRALATLEDLAKATGGQSLRELDPMKWTNAIRKLYAKVAPDRLIRQAVPVTFLAEFSQIPPRQVPLWNQTWLKDAATSIATARDPSGNRPIAARWNVGSGHVLAIAFPAEPRDVQHIAKSVARPPRDNRFKITWDTGPDLRVIIDAVDHDNYLNNLPLELELAPTPPATSPTTISTIPQTGPGRYEITVRSPRNPALATVRCARQILDRIALAGRYPPEFDAIGNNVERMKELAGNTAGKVIPPDQTHPIRFDWPTRDLPLTSCLAVAGTIFILGGLLWWRLL